MKKQFLLSRLLLYIGTSFFLLVGFSNCQQHLHAPNQLDQISKKASPHSMANEQQLMEQLITTKSKHIVCEELRAQLSPEENIKALELCLDRADTGGTVFLPARIYEIQRTLFVKKPIWITTEGLDPSKTACQENRPVRCAELKAIGPFSVAERGVLRIGADDVTLSHIVVNGNKDARRETTDSQDCASQTRNSLGVNIHAFGTRLIAHKISSIDAICSTALEITSSVKNMKLTSNYIARAGVHNENNMWADGVTIHDSENSVITDNEFIDNTDVDLIFGGCKNCTISYNRIIHTDQFRTSTYAGLMLHSWQENTSGNYEGTAVTNNVIDCSNYRCGFGLLIGSHPWYTGRIFGGTYLDNIVTGAQVGIAINTVTGPISVGANTVHGASGRFESSNGFRETHQRTISPASSALINWLPTAEKTDYVEVDYAGAILNWWTQDWTQNIAAGAGPQGASLPAPTSSEFAQFVTQVYMRYLERAPEASGIQHWTQQLTQGYAKKDFIRDVLISTEFNVKHNVDHLDSSQYIQFLYLKILGRAADAEGLATWTSHLSQGKTHQFVIENILNSGEAASSNSY